VFKLLFSADRNRDILISFLTAVLRPSSPIKSVTIKNPWIPGSDELKRQIYLDVKVELASGEQVDVEMQARRYGGPRPRWLFHWGSLYTDQLLSGDEFAVLKPVIGIVIMNYTEFQTARFHSTFRVAEVHTHEEFSDHLEIHALELPKLEQAVGDPEDQAVLGWGKFFAAETDEEREEVAMNYPNIAPAKEALDILSDDPEARALARERQLGELTYQSGLREAKAEGKAESLQEMIRDLCLAFGIELDASREERLTRGTAEELQSLLKAISVDHRWPQD
jgi:predicted transposase/invertase (TIGR01784 family)